MKNRFRLVSYIIIAALFVQNIVFAAPDTVITDNDAAWEMQWNWARNQEGFEYVSSQISTENGLKLVVDTQKFNDFASYRYPSKDNGVTKCEASGEYQYYIKLDESGNPVAYDSNVANARPVMVFHQGRDNYFAQFNVGETQNNGKPIIFSYDFDTSTQDNADWSSPRVSLMGFTLRHNVNNMYQIVHNGGEMNIEKDSSRQKHSVSVVIAPTVTDGRYEMTAIMVDDVVTPLSGVYSTTSGKTDADCYLSKLDFTLRLAADRYAEISNLKVVRGLEDIVLSTDFADGGELGNEGINISSSTQLVENAMDNKIKVYDCDFGDELIADPGTVITYNDSGANVQFTKLEAGGNYRMELTGIKDAWGNEYTDTFSVSFATPEGESGVVDDTPDSEAGSSDISSGDISIGSANTNYHGHGFYAASKTDDTYEIVIATEDWWNAEQNKSGKDNFYWYTDAEGNEKLLGYGNSSWNKLDLEIALDETVNTGEPLVVSYDWYSENFGGLGEWSTNYMNIMDIQCYLSDSGLSQTMLKYYKKGTTVTETAELKTTSDGWHNIKLVISPELQDGRCKVDAVILDGEVTFLEDVYSNTSSYTEETFILNKLGISIAPPKATSTGEGRLKIRNIDIKRVDGLSAEMFMPLGIQNPEESIKLNFNYPISAELSGKDFTIYELTETAGEDGSNVVKETAIANSISVSKAYDGKQLVLTVGDGGLYYNKSYKLVINKNIVVEDYISLTKKEYEFSTYEYPDDLTAELTRSGAVINYNISGGGDSFCIMVSTYDSEGALVGLNCVNAQKEGSGSRKKARGSVSITNPSAGEKVMVHIFTGDGTMKLYRLPTEF